LAKSAGVILRSYDLDEVEQLLYSQGFIATEEAATSVISTAPNPDFLIGVKSATPQQP
jgi:uncharacterized protein YaaQ